MRSLKTLVCGISFSPLRWRWGYFNQNHPYFFTGPFNQNHPYFFIGPFNQNHPYFFIGPFTLWCDWPHPWGN